MTLAARPLPRRSLLAAPATLAVSGCANRLTRAATAPSAPTASSDPTVSPGTRAYRALPVAEETALRGGMPYRSELTGRASMGIADAYFSSSEHVIGEDAPLPADADARERAEFASTWHIEAGQDVWVSFQVNVQAASPEQWLLLNQFHDIPDEGSFVWLPPFAMELERGTNALVLAARSATRHIKTGREDIITSATIRIEDFQRNWWHHFVYHLVFSRTGGGLLEIWHDGRQLHGGPTPIGFNDTEGPYFKFGAYRAAQVGRARVEYANVELSRTSLRDRVTSPLPLTPVTR